MNLSKLGGTLGSVSALAVIVAGFVVLAVRGEDTGAFLSLVGPIVSGLFVVGQVNARSDAQDQALTTITRQTNGVLDARIREGVAAVLAAQDTPPGVAGTPGGFAATTRVRDNPGLSPAPDNSGLSSNGRSVGPPADGA